jgi:hypothetical protein
MFETYNYSIKILSITAAVITNSQVTKKLTNLANCYAIPIICQFYRQYIIKTLMAHLRGSEEKIYWEKPKEHRRTAGRPAVRTSRRLAVVRRRSSGAGMQHRWIPYNAPRSVAPNRLPESLRSRLNPHPPRCRRPPACSCGRASCPR